MRKFFKILAKYFDDFLNLLDYSLYLIKTIISYIIPRNKEKTIEIMAQTIIYLIYLVILWIIIAFIYLVILWITIALFGWEPIICLAIMGFLVYLYYKISPKIKEYVCKITTNKFIQNKIYDMIFCLIFFLLEILLIFLAIYFQT